MEINKVTKEQGDFSVKINYGLEGAYFTESKICKVDGVNGKLYYRGYSIEELASHSNFEEVSFLLLNGKLPRKDELEEFSANLKKERELPKEIVHIIKNITKKEDPMHILRTAVSALSAYDPEADVNTKEANMRKSIRLISKMASITAAIGRFKTEKEYIAPDNSLGHSANFLYMLHGNKPSEKEIKIFDRMLLLHAEHSSNASTFSVLVTGSTLSDIYSAITSGIGTLKGPLHGEADENALRMLYEIKSPDNAERYINDALSGKQRIMGFGHRVYKTYDPRARVIRETLEEIKSSSPEVKNLVDISFKIETMMIEKLGRSHGIWPNVDFFSGPVYTYLGVPIELFTPVFAVSRVSGWCSHLLEYWENNRLIRPLDYYTGELDLKYPK